jgi:hypothetical protein
VQPFVPPPLSNSGASLHGLRGASSWLTSLVIHLGALLLLALWVIPAGSGLLRTLTIEATTGNDAAGPLFTLGPDEFSLPEPQDSRQTLPPPDPLERIAEPTPLGLAEIVPQSAPLGETPEPLDAKIAGSRRQSADAMFFGTSASGRNFVFILDISGSMSQRSGGRFLRARDELIESVSRMREDQNFYVYLFNWSTVPMFGVGNDPGGLIPANPENIAKLQSWLYSITPISGTDPRAALRGAHAFGPDAIFLLSDGKFNKPPRTDPQRGWDASLASVFDQLSHPDRPDVQINTIAFEDLTASQGMERIAEMTSGQFTFVAAPGQQALVDVERASAGPEYVPQTREEKLQMAEDVLRLRRAYRLLQRDLPERARELAEGLDPNKLPRDARRMLGQILR